MDGVSGCFSGQHQPSRENQRFGPRVSYIERPHPPACPACCTTLQDHKAEDHRYHTPRLHPQAYLQHDDIPSASPNALLTTLY